MADNSATDLLMVFLDQSGTSVGGECTTAFDTSDTTMMQNFTAGSFFEVEDFGMSAGIEDSDSSDLEEGDSSSNANENTLHGTGKGSKGSGKSGSKEKRKSAKFKRYVENGLPATSSGQNGLGYDVHLEEITITRQIDSASTKLLQLCLSQTPLQLAVVVKRKFTGNMNYHEAYLRIEFKEPLLTSMEWEEGEVVKEKVKFVYRGITAVYKPQKPDGSLDSSKQVSYDYETDVATAS